MRRIYWIIPALLLSLLCLVVYAAEGNNDAKPDPPEDFTLKAANADETFKLSEHDGEFVALHFLLETDCPNCMKLVYQYKENEKKFDDLVHVFIKPDGEPAILGFVEKLESRHEMEGPVTVYRDADAKLAKAYGIPGGYEFHGRVVHYPALILLGPDGKEIWRHVGKNNRDRVWWEQFEGKFPELKKKVGAPATQPVTEEEATTKTEKSNE